MVSSPFPRSANRSSGSGVFGHRARFCQVDAHLPKGPRFSRYFHIHENDDLDETPFESWVGQAGNLPGERL